MPNLKENKEAIQNFKIPRDVKDDFNELCKKNFTTASHELRQFTYKKIAELRLKEKS